MSYHMYVYLYRIDAIRDTNNIPKILFLHKLKISQVASLISGTQKPLTFNLYANYEPPDFSKCNFCFETFQLKGTERKRRYINLTWGVGNLQGLTFKSADITRTRAVLPYLYNCLLLPVKPRCIFSRYFDGSAMRVYVNYVYRRLVQHRALTFI